MTVIAFLAILAMAANLFCVLSIQDKLTTPLLVAIGIAVASFTVPGCILALNQLGVI